MKKIKVGIIGLGYWGPNLVRNFLNNPNVKLEKVCDLKNGRIEFIQEKFPGIEVTSDMMNIINDKNIDAVAVATPVNTHKDIAKLCLLNNKHIFVEKPFTDNYKDGLELLNLAKETGKIIAVGHIFQFAPAVTCIKENIEKGILGDLYHLTAQRINLGPPKTTVNVLWDLGPHDLSIILYVFNEFPDKVKAFGNSYWWNGIIDNCHMFLDFPSGKTAHIHLGWLSSNKTRIINLFVEKGNILYDETKPDNDKVIFFDKGVDTRINAKDNEATNLKYGTGEIIKLKLNKGEPLALEINAFVNSVLLNEPPINDGKIGTEVIKILEAATLSMKGINNEELLRS